MMRGVQKKRMKKVFIRFYSSIREVHTVKMDARIQKVTEGIFTHHSLKDRMILIVCSSYVDVEDDQIVRLGTQNEGSDRRKEGR